MTNSTNPGRSPRSSLRGRLVESSGSMGRGYRDRRWSTVSQLFPDIEDMEVVDLGGTVDSWVASPVRPRRVVVLNVADERDGAVEWIETIRGDACDLPGPVRRTRFDLVFSNSVIEHVGGHARREQFAESVNALADRHWVQTPYRYFPVEPHWLFPGFQFLPVLLRALIYERWPLAHTRPSDRCGALRSVMGTELLSTTELEYYFPGSRTIRERVGPLTKSIVAVRT